MNAQWYVGKRHSLGMILGGGLFILFAVIRLLVGDSGPTWLVSTRERDDRFDSESAAEEYAGRQRERLGRDGSVEFSDEPSVYRDGRHRRWIADPGKQDDASDATHGMVRTDGGWTNGPDQTVYVAISEIPARKTNYRTAAMVMAMGGLIWVGLGVWRGLVPLVRVVNGIVTLRPGPRSHMVFDAKHTPLNIHSGNIVLKADSDVLIKLTELRPDDRKAFIELIRDARREDSPGDESREA